MKLRAALGLLCLSLIACAGSAKTPAEAPIPARAETAGQALLERVPRGADLVLEVDLARLRGNALLADLLERVSAPEALREGDLLQQADTAVVCVYGIGDGARQLVLLRSADKTLPGALSLAPGVFAVGDPGLLRRAEALVEPSESTWNDPDFRRLRARVMPEKAESATVRLVARLDFDARVSLAAKVAMSDVPVSIALWGDVVDDLAIVADLATAESEEVARLERAIVGLQAKLSSEVFLRYLGVAPAIRRARVTRSASGVRVVFVVAPKRLRYVLDRIASQFLKASP